jgi:5'-3' exonuclease
MGLKRFHQATKHLIEDASSDMLSLFGGGKVACDASSWLHKSGVVHARRFFLGTESDESDESPWKPWCEYIEEMIKLLRDHDIEPIVVFDGSERLVLKDSTSEHRTMRRQNAMKEAILLENESRTDEAEKKWMQAFAVTPEMEEDAKTLLTSMDVDYRVASHEADYEIGMLVRDKVVQAVITEDSDLFGYGCERLIFKLKLNGNFQLLDCSREYTTVEEVGKKRQRGTVITVHDMSHKQRALMATFMGNDYLVNPPGVGVMKVYALVRQSGESFDEMIGHLRRVTPDHITEPYVEKAKCVFSIFSLEL